MSDLKDVSPINLLTGMSVVSLATGNKLGQIVEPYIDPINGILSGATLLLTDGRLAWMTHDRIYSFGRDAIMTTDESALMPLDDEMSGTLGQPASKLIGTSMITESGDLLGQITDVFITFQPPPRIVYEARQSIIDKLLGRGFFVPAAVGHALSDNAARLIVPDLTRDIASTELGDVLGQRIEIRSYDPTDERIDRDEDDTVVIRDEDDTIVRMSDDEDTVLRPPRPVEQ